jgi:prolyl oligopeptidase
LGEPQEKDRLVYERPDHPDWGFQAFVSKNGRYLVILVWHGADPNNLIFVKDLGNPEEPNFDAPIHPVIDQFTAEYGAIAVLGDQLYVRTDNGAPNYRIVRLDLANPDNGELKEVVSETKDLLEGAAMASGKLVLSYLIDAKSQVFITDLDGKREAEIKLPTLGTVAGLEADQTRSEVFYAFTSFLYPTTIYRYDVDTHRNEVFRKPTVDFSVDDYETRQIFYQSKDGTRIPMFVVCRKDLKLDGSNPVFLTGYGGFNVSLTPSFSTTVITWLQKGGVFAQPNLRGGGEYGREWHLAGTREHKQNVFDDFIAAAEALIDQKYTSKQHLAITGGSNGGLLIGAVLTQRPDLFAACVPQVGVMDMLRFQKFTGGFAWVSDYGSSDNPDDFKFLIKYSPLHNLKPGVCYPPTLITTGDHDDRVVPGHSFKFAATLQAYQGCDKPVLIRIDTNAGHGGGKPLSKQIAERADILAFMWDHTKAGPVQ